METAATRPARSGLPVVPRPPHVFSAVFGRLRRKRGLTTRLPFLCVEKGARRVHFLPSRTTRSVQTTLRREKDSRHDRLWTRRGDVARVYRLDRRNRRFLSGRRRRPARLTGSLTLDPRESRESLTYRVVISRPGAIRVARTGCRHERVACRHRLGRLHRHNGDAAWLVLPPKRPLPAGPTALIAQRTRKRRGVEVERPSQRGDFI